ncbi:hypothetical protein OA007_00785, partial [SAR116 cluster bacterium]|nr:hypothetical protein [SAR116 cluster bacterium]
LPPPMTRMPSSTAGGSAGNSLPMPKRTAAISRQQATVRIVSIGGGAYLFAAAALGAVPRQLFRR